MRVVAGFLKGRRLLSPPDRDIRPTSDRVKEGMFNILQFSLKDADVLDLFAGTGQLGIEALSRGAAHCTFVDGAPSSCKILKTNLSLCALEEKATVICCKAEKFLTGTLQLYDIILLDPPYHRDLILPLLPLLSLRLKEEGKIICEAESTLSLPEEAGSLIKSKEYRYGKIKLIVYEKGGTLI